jgi:signal transduction histidine kinase
MRAVVHGLTGQAGVIELDGKGRLRRANPKGRELLSAAGANENAPLSGSLAPLRCTSQERATPRELPLSLPTGQTILARATPVKSGTLLTLEDISAVEYMKRVTSWAPVAQRLAHDIKNPLTAMALTLQRLDKHRTPETVRYYASMRDEIDRLKKMADGFMRLSKLDPPKLAPGSVNHLVRTCLARFDSAKPPGINIVFELADDLPPVALDPEQLSVACSNIIENAISSMGDAGEMVVRTSFIVDDRRVVVSVSDTGKGIPERYLDKVFEPFFTLKPGGTGLGMAITKRIIEDHKGTISIQSKEGEGTTVTITLPAATSHA